MKRIFLFFVIIICCSDVMQAQTASTDDSIASYEDEDYETRESIESKAFSNPIPRQMSADTMAALKKQEAFAYMQYIDSFFRNHRLPKETAIKATKEKPTTSIFSNPGLRALYWLIAFAAVAWIVWRLFIGSGAVFTRNRTLHTTNYTDETSAVTDVPMESLVDKAIAEGNYRLAIRYLYLQTLSVLGEKNLLALAPQKTNYQYIQELKGNLQQAKFSRLTLQYEYAWYGNFKLSAAQFDRTYHDFQTFISNNR